MARNKFDIDETLEKDSEFNLSHLIRLKKYIAAYSRQLLFTAVIMIVSSILALIWPYLLKIAIDSALPPEHSNIPLIVLLAAIWLTASVINLFLLKLKIKTMSRVGQGIIRDLRQDLFNHLQELPFSYYDSRPHGKILVRVVNPE